VCAIGPAALPAVENATRGGYGTSSRTRGATASAPDQCGMCA
jgi:hypothetical protein